MQVRRLTPALLALSVAILAPLIPGGPIETRTFPDMSPLIATLYNTLITIVGLGAIPLAWFTRRHGHTTLLLAIADAVGFAGIYGCDLLGIFPIPPPQMSTTVRVFEIAGVIVALAVMGSAMRDLNRPSPQRTSTSMARRTLLVTIVVTTLIAALIVYFGTVEALRQQ